MSELKEFAFALKENLDCFVWASPDTELAGDTPFFVEGDRHILPVNGKSPCRTERDANSVVRAFSRVPVDIARQGLKPNTKL